MDLSDAKALTAGQYVKCAICSRWVGPSDLHRLTVEDAVMCWRVIEALEVRATLTVEDGEQVIHAHYIVDRQELGTTSRTAHS
jgi:hypothetical protein